MQTKIALLRGINVGGKRKIKMIELKTALTTLKFSEIKTYIQSGNIVFKTKTTQSNQALASTIHQLLLSTFNLEVPVIVFDTDYIQNIVTNNPYREKDNFLNRLYVSFFHSEPLPTTINSFDNLSFNNDLFQTNNTHIYILYDTKQSQSKLTNNLIENKFKVSATTRNWKTVLKLLELSK